MLRTRSCWCLCWISASVLLSPAHGHAGDYNQERPPCQPGFYCPAGSSSPVPCPEGTYGPTAEAVSVDGCLTCPPHHYCPRAGLSAFSPCGPEAVQPLPGQDACICPGEGQRFQASDGRCHCTIGYQPTGRGDACMRRLYDVCADGEARTQHGDCLDRRQWSLHCSRQVCESAADYRGYDTELGLCVCSEPPGRAACRGLCPNRAATELTLRCRSDGEAELAWSSGGQVLGVSDLIHVKLLNKWDSPPCSRHDSSHLVYIVQTTEAGFLGLLDGLPTELQQPHPASTQPDAQSSADIPDSDVWLEAVVKNISDGEKTSSNMRGSRYNLQEDMRSVTGILNPTACLHMGDVIMFTVNARHYPQYDLDNLYNTNADFDWGAFRQLEEELTLSWTPPSLFSFPLTQPGVYVFTLSSNQHKHLYVRVMPAGAQCYEPGPFFPAIPHHMTRMGIRRRRNLLLRPDWLVTGGLLFGAVVILCLCVTLLILFREYGWPEKGPVRPRYRSQQLAYHMDDYSSKGSRVVSLRKTHRNQQTRLTQDSIQAGVCTDASEDFWDYEHQVDLEAFSSNTFYSLLLKQSLSVTMRLGQLTAEVKELYQGVLGKLQLLHPCLIAEERVGERNERMRREVEREAFRRKTLASQLRTLLDRQLQVVRQEQQAQQRAHSLFTTHLKQCTRLVSTVYDHDHTSCELEQQNLLQRLTALVDEMGELVSGECQRQGAWGFMGEGTGAKLLCPNTGTVLNKGDIFGPDGGLRAGQALHQDPVTGLIRANPQSLMLLNSGHALAVPPEYVLHPQTGRIVPIAGNLAYDPASSALVFTTDLCTDDSRKWDSPLLPFIPYPVRCQSDQPLPTTRLRGLRPGHRPQLGAPMADPDTGVPVPTLGVTIHPQTGQLYPLGGLHVCPITRLPQPIQIGYPMLDPRTGNVVLTVGVALDPVTGAVLPVGGLLLYESFVDPLSGRMLRVGGASMSGATVVPNAGGYQALLDSKVLAAMFKVLQLLKPLTGEWGSDPSLRHQPPRGSVGDRGSRRRDGLGAAAQELQQAWGRSLHGLLQLQARLEMLLDWAAGVQQDGGALGEIRLPGSDVCVPALLGMEYPDPVGSGLSVPVLGSQTDPISGSTVPLAGTMQDPEGKGLVPIRYGAHTVDPVTGVLAPVVGARLDVSRKSIVPLTACYWLTVVDRTDSIQVEALQREVCARNTYWQQQRQREEDVLSDLDAALFQGLFQVTKADSSQVQWSGRQLREAAAELQDSAQAEAQRRAGQHSHLAVILPGHVVHILTQGDKDEWDQQWVWHSELVSGLDKLDVCVEQLQQEQEKWPTQERAQASARKLRLKELWEQTSSRQTELETALSMLHFVRQLSQLRADTAQAVLCGNFWYKEYGLVQSSGHVTAAKVMGFLKQKTLPLLETLKQLLEDKLPSSPSHQQISGFDFGHAAVPPTKQTCGLEAASGVWTVSVPVVKGISTQTLREPVNVAQAPDPALEPSSAQTRSSQRHTASSGIYSQESQSVKEPRPAHNPAEDWAKLLQLSPAFQVLKAVEQQLKTWACGTGLLRPDDRCNTFMDILDAQWECEGELIPLDPSVLSPREFLVYQHGLYLMHALHHLKLTPIISLQIASSLPINNYYSNAFRNSFFFQEAEETLFVRRHRLQSVGGFSLLLIHCLSHIASKDMCSDSRPAFRRLFFKLLQASLEELFEARLGIIPSGLESNFSSCFQDQDHSGDLKGTTASLASRLTRLSRGGLFEHGAQEFAELHKKHSAVSLSELEGLLREKID
ncbi:uncharacterized protein si:dkey-103g5.4 isoform X2 [Betta splendens]|uniref:Uncharacterized protein si:dkey-103g5.4 isoform X2 n=1 Tax=Betta splendens TaxID=158456 RepID=A0A8M1HLW1_BETSP|nr:uncharacterized protein si:dkey-103g5.4 isoform X2 [Betta splendens]